MNPHFNNSGAAVSVKRSVPPALYAAGATNGASIDKLAFGNPQSVKLVAQTGAIAGAPAAQTYDAKLQDSADNSTFADYVPPRGVAADAAITQITAANTAAEKNIDVSSSRRYLRAVGTAGFTAGTSPTIGAEAHLVIGGGDTLPQS
jgi:succinate dehydrogenase/fumarate reductase flavoprotein subunit